jgi:hypothetical protein
LSADQRPALCCRGTSSGGGYYGLQGSSGMDPDERKLLTNFLLTRISRLAINRTVR